MKEDAELLNAFATQRDEASFRELVDRRIGFVYAVNFRRLRDVHLAQDATQAVFVALANKAGTVARSPSVIGWLHRSSCYESLNLMRAQSNRLTRETEAERLGTTTGGTLPSADVTGALERILDDVLNELPDADREIVIARYFSDQSYTQIGAQTGRSENATRMRTDRALSRLRDQLETRGFSSATDVLAGLLPAYATAAVPSGLASSTATAAFTALGAGVSSVSLFLSMSTTKILTAAAAFAVVAFVGIEAYQTQQLRSELDELRQQNAQTAQSYRSLEKEIAELKASSSSTRTASGVPAPNPGEQTATSAKTTTSVPGFTRTPPAGWHKNGSNAQLFDVGVDPANSFGGIPSAYVKSVDESAEQNFGGMMQSTSADQYKNQRVRMTGWIKTQDANDRGAHLWLRVDSPTPGKLLGFDNMDNRAPKGTTDWQEYSIVLDVPNDAKSLNYGVFLSGRGQMWVNGVAIERVSADTPTTDMLTAPKTAVQKSLPTAPVNLDFNPTPKSGG